mgnify:CR=1 FL=1
MRKLIIFCSTLFLFSCGQNSSEKQLNGKWYGIENDGYTKIHFYPDSLVYDEEYKETVEWTASKQEIEFSLPSNLWLDSIKDVTVKYKLSNNKDTLFGTFINMNGEVKSSLLRADNYIEYLNKLYEIKFSLPKSDTVKLIETDKIYGMKIFMGISGDKIIAKTELSENLNNLETDILKFKDSIRPYEEYQIETHEWMLDTRFHLRVFADKKIADSTITKYLKATIYYNDLETSKHLPEESKKVVRDTLPIRIFRIFKGKEEVKRWNIKGREIKTIANNVYIS